jgi:hypothetical protein
MNPSSSELPTSLWVSESEGREAEGPELGATSGALASVRYGWTRGDEKGWVGQDEGWCDRGKSMNPDRAWEGWARGQQYCNASPREQPESHIIKFRPQSAVPTSAALIIPSSPNHDNNANTHSSRQNQYPRLT